HCLVRAVEGTTAEGRDVTERALRRAAEAVLLLNDTGEIGVRVRDRGHGGYGERERRACELRAESAGEQKVHHLSAHRNACSCPRTSKLSGRKMKSTRVSMWGKKNQSAESHGASSGWPAP